MNARGATVTYESVTLDGCAPTPLASYLKALGVLRLISSDANHVSGRAADPKARGWWENERFHLRTRLSRDAMCQFFLDDYAPSPIIAPWNGRAGFLEGEEQGGASDASMRPKAERVARLEKSKAQRFRNLRKTITGSRVNRQIDQYNRLRAYRKAVNKEVKTVTGDKRGVLEDKKRRADKEERKIKDILLPTMRSTTDLQHLAYIDTCFVLSSENVAAPLLVGGGVDGSRDFGCDFLEALEEMFDPDSGNPFSHVAFELKTAVFAVGERSNRCGSLGLFTPMQSGLKSTTGFEVGGDKEIYPLNSWDVVLAMEGVMVFAGALTRRWGSAGDARSAFPFTFDAIGAGTGGLSSTDHRRLRGEIWTPLWRKSATFSEISAVFAEGRLTLGRRAARTGLDAARSVAQIGQSRGISGFERYSLIQSDSKKPYQATPLGRFNTPARPRRDLIEDLEAGNWLENARGLAGGKSAPAHARSAMRRLEDALFQMTDANRAVDGACNALMALGEFIGWLANNPKAREGLRPPPALSAAWIKAADDESPEFRVAAALAGLGLPSPRADGTEPPDVNSGATDDTAQAPETSKALPMAGHFAPISEDSFSDGQRLRRPRRWSDSTTVPNVVWGTGNLVSNMTSVLERRLVEAVIRGFDDKPLAGATGARLADVAAFLAGDFDDSRSAALLAGLIWARPTRLRMACGAQSTPVPFAYAVLKPIFTPDRTLRRIGALAQTARLPIPSGLVSRLRDGGPSLDGKATDGAVRIALARCRGSGVPSPFDPARAGGRAGAEEGSRMGAGLRANRLAAALLIPVGDNGLKTLVNLAYPGAIPEHNAESTEDTTDAAA